MVFPWRVIPYSSSRASWRCVWQVAAHIVAVGVCIVQSLVGNVCIYCGAIGASRPLVGQLQLGVHPVLSPGSSATLVKPPPPPWLAQYALVETSGAGRVGMAGCSSLGASPPLPICEVGRHLARATAVIPQRCLGASVGHGSCAFGILVLGPAPERVISPIALASSGRPLRCVAGGIWSSWPIGPLAGKASRAWCLSPGEPSSPRSLVVPHAQSARSCDVRLAHKRHLRNPFLLLLPSAQSCKDLRDSCVFLVRSSRCSSIGTTRLAFFRPGYAFGGGLPACASARKSGSALSSPALLRHMVPVPLCRSGRLSQAGVAPCAW